MAPQAAWQRHVWRRWNVSRSSIRCCSGMQWQPRCSLPACPTQTVCSPAQPTRVQDKAAACHTRCCSEPISCCALEQECLVISAGA